MKRISLFTAVMTAILTLSVVSCTHPQKVNMSKEVLMDKIKGAWAGQTIGCTYGGPTEFWYNGVMINDTIEIPWTDGIIKYYYENRPGLYDDVYMDLTFVDVFAKMGLDAPVEAFEQAFAYAEYPLWHANQQGRYNIRNGINSPSAGHWKHNPHADDIDFQIEADYAGIMAPGMVNAASYYCDDIGHMMNYGDGWYGGVYVAAMYALAFVYDDIHLVVEDALKVIPEQSRFYRCMKDVIECHKSDPDNWKNAWMMCNDRHSFDIGCPEGVYQPFNIDAVINSAYIIIGLLYGDGDFARTIDISTRCGYDSDCNPASSGGILGTMLGYSAIPEKWMANLREVEDMDFAYTDISLNDVYQMSFDQALQVIERNGGKVSGDDVTIKCQEPEAVRFEQAFAGLWPKPLIPVRKELRDVESISFEGSGVVVRYTFFKSLEEAYSKDRDNEYVAQIEVMVDGKLHETVSMPVADRARKLELFYTYDLEEGPHVLTFNWLNPQPGKNIHILDCVAYGSMTLNDIHIRDPYIMPVEKDGLYYMYCSSSVKRGDKTYGGVSAYTSRDLKTWEGPVRVFEVPHDNFLTGGVWAPEVHEYNGRYYLFATLNTNIKWKGDQEDHPAFTHRATQIFHSDSPMGPFLPFEKKQPHTPMGHMCLDGTLWVENGTPYMIYCHEWVEVRDGEMCMVELKKDLSEPVGQPVRLFCASAAEWSTGSDPGNPQNSTYVTDGCFLYRTKTGKLLMIWSSFKNGSYAIGIAESATGNVYGPWLQQDDLLFEAHGGHGMIFKTFDGRLCLVFHAPNSPGGAERAHIYEIEDTGETLLLKAELPR